MKFQLEGTSGRQEKKNFRHYCQCFILYTCVCIARDLVVDFILPLKSDIKGREQVWAGMFAMIHLCQWWGQGDVPLHWTEEGGRERGWGGWNVTAECQTLFPDEIIRDSSEAARRRSASQIQKNAIKLKSGGSEKYQKVTDP